jgi:hypothetical protein
MFDMRLWILISMIVYIPAAFSQLPVPSPFSSEFDDTDMAPDLQEAFTFTKYPTHDQYIAMMDSLARAHPQICHLDTIGYSELGRPILVLKLSGDVKRDEGKAKFFYTSTMHGDEILGYVLLLRLAKLLLDNYGRENEYEINRLVDSLEIWINPLSNPDGAFRDNDSTLVNAWRFTDRGYGVKYDLNRNFPDPAAGEPDDTSGRLTETKDMMEFMKLHRFNMSANLHCGAEVVNFPWDYAYGIYHPDSAWFYLISREYADEARVHPGYMDDFTDGVTIGWDWYVINGGRQDYVTYYLNGREITLELSNTFMVESEQLDLYWDYNDRSLINLLSQATYGIRGKVSSRQTGTPIKARVEIPGHDNEISYVYSDRSFGRFYRYLKEGTYDLVFSADGYINDTINDVFVEDFKATWMDVRMDSIAEPSGVAAGKFSDDWIRLYPNPTLDRLYVQLVNPSLQLTFIRIYSLEGRHIATVPVNREKMIFELQTSHLEKGMYLLELEFKQGISVYKFIKQ